MSSRHVTVIKAGQGIQTDIQPDIYKAPVKMPTFWCLSAYYSFCLVQFRFMTAHFVTQRKHFPLALFVLKAFYKVG